MSLPTRAEFEQMLGQYANALAALIDPTSDAGKTAVIAAERRRALSDAFDAQAAEVVRLTEDFDGLGAEHAYSALVFEWGTRFRPRSCNVAHRGAPCTAAKSKGGGHMTVST